MRNIRTKSLDVSPKVRKAVYKRDSIDDYPNCVTCGNPGYHDMSHIVKRSKSGLGIPENLINQCRECHEKMESGDEGLMQRAQEHLKHYYPGWTIDSEELRYKRE